MNLLLPEVLDDSVRGFTVTYWIDRSQKWLLQYSSVETLPCFGQIDGVRRKFAIPFEPSTLYRECAICLASNTHPEAPWTECPCLNIGLSLRSFSVNANLRANEESLSSGAGRDLADYLKSVIAKAEELVA